MWEYAVYQRHERYVVRIEWALDRVAADPFTTPAWGGADGLGSGRWVRPVVRRGGLCEPAGMQSDRPAERHMGVQERGLESCDLERPGAAAERPRRARVRPE